MDDSQNLRKYEELYSLSKAGLEDEIGRFKRIDEKASRYLAFVSLFLAALGFIVKDVGNLLAWGTVSFWLIAASILGMFSATLVSLYALFLTLRIQPLKKIPMSPELIQFFDRNSYLDIIYALTKGNIEAAQENKITTDRKTNRLTTAYRALMVALFFLSICICTALFLSYNMVRSRGVH